MGKKSWNVYNQANIEKVKRDEAVAAAQEAAEEERMQEVDAEQRMRILRGEPTDDLDALAKQRISPARPTSDHPDHGERVRKRRRLAGEDDTERDLRYAKEDQALSLSRKEMKPLKAKSSDAPLHDRAGHINLFPTEVQQASRAQKKGNPEKEAEDAKKKQEYENQFTMKFSNAAGFRQSIGEKPWYSAGADLQRSESEVTVSKDVRGNDDPRRKERASMRLAVDDPLSAIQRGVDGVRKAEKGRKAWKEQRLREVDELIEAERKSSRRHKRHKHHHEHREHHEHLDDLDGFTLDGADPKAEERKHHHKHRHRDHQDRHLRRYRSRDRSRTRRSPGRSDKRVSGRGSIVATL